MKSRIVVAAIAALVPSYALAQEQDDCWGPAQLSASAPDAESRDSIRMLSHEDTAILLAAAAKHHQHPVAGIETIYSARYSEDAARVLVFAFNKKNCLVDRGAIPLDEWGTIFGPAI
jgi:hypothetical protein